MNGEFYLSQQFNGGCGCKIGDTGEAEDCGCIGPKVNWTSNTAGKGVAPYLLNMQKDGNLVLSDSTKATMWESGTAGQG